jgi:phosphatidate cytidylyltransferase
MKRVATALVLIPLFCYVILGAPDWLFFSVLIAVAVLCFREFGELVLLHEIERPGLFGYAAGIALLLLPQAQTGFIALAALLAMALSLRSRDLTGALPFAACLILGVLYIFGSLRCAADLRAIDKYWLLLALSLNWGGDIAAFYVGRTIGKHKLAPRVSPAKSVEGSIASVAGSVAYGAVFAHYLLPTAPLAEVLPIVAITNIAGQVGDLCESALKRGAGVKDSGTLLPGHGGWLDRVDSNLFALPVAYTLVSSLLK